MSAATDPLVPDCPPSHGELRKMVSTQESPSSRKAPRRLREVIVVLVLVTSALSLAGCAQPAPSEPGPTSATPVLTPDPVETFNPNERLGETNDVTEGEMFTILLNFYDEMTEDGLRAALVERSQAEIDTIRQAMDGYESAEVMSTILNGHGFGTDSWIFDS